MKNKTLLKLAFLLIGLQVFGQSTNITVDGTSRNMIVYAPTNLGTNRPLVISMHGMNQDAPYQQGMARWEYVADTAKFVVVYPNGQNKSWDLSGTKDINFILAIIDDMYTKYSIDKSRVYLSGFSMGGMMTYFAMNKIADKIAAFAPVSGYLMGGPNPTSSRPVPIIHTHGDSDGVVPYSGTAACMSAWVQRNNCPTTAVITKPYPVDKPASQSSRSYWGPGDCQVEVVLLTLAGKDHEHSNDNNAVHTTKEIWKFVRRYTTACGMMSSLSTSITAPANNAVFSAPATIDITASASVASGGTISKVEFYNGTTKLGEDATAPYTYSWTNVAEGSYSLTTVVTDNAGKKATSSAVAIKVNPPQGPYLGTAWPIPGKIEFENYDVGGNGAAYLDNSAGTSVSPAPNFRTDEDVDIENCTDTDGGYNIGYSTAGEWLEYTVNVAATGKYNLLLRVAANGTGRTISIATESGTAIASNIAIPNTGGWQTWTNLEVKDVSLTVGKQVIRVTIGATDYVNLNYMTFSTTSTLPPTVVTPITYCQGATATALTATGTALKWYTTATGGTASTTAPVPSTTATGSTTYYVTQTLNSLESERAAIVVTVNATPAAPTVTTPVNYKIGDVATALSATGTSLKWYPAATGGPALASAPVPSTASAATTKYYVSQTVSTCESSRAEIIVVVTPLVVPKVTLKAGWNLIGCPIKGSTDIEKALSSVWSQVITVKNADSYWQVSNTIPGLNTLLKLNWGEGYLIKVKANCELDWIVR